MVKIENILMLGTDTAFQYPECAYASAMDREFTTEDMEKVAVIQCIHPKSRYVTCAMNSMCKSCPFDSERQGGEK